MQLMERRRGNEHYRSRNFQAARQHYDRALAVVELVKGAGPEEQHEIDANRLAVLLNLAALHLESGDFSQAAISCSQALEIDGSNAKGLLRRAKAYIAMHDYEVRPIHDDTATESKISFQPANHCNPDSVIMILSKSSVGWLQMQSSSVRRGSVVRYTHMFRLQVVQRSS